MLHLSKDVIFSNPAPPRGVACMSSRAGILPTATQDMPVKMVLLDVISLSLPIATGSLDSDIGAFSLKYITQEKGGEDCSKGRRAARFVAKSTCRCRGVFQGPEAKRLGTSRSNSFLMRTTQDPPR